jgi:hypothetical protein
MAYSVPDSRATPNDSRDENGTLIYDVQISSNAEIPPTDSRTDVPVASDAALPQNSRNNP